MATVQALREFTYILEADRELIPARQTRFLLRTLPDQEVAGLEPIGILNAGLIGWENLAQPDGTNAPFATELRDGRRALTDDTLNLISPSWAVELAAAIVAETRRAD